MSTRPSWCVALRRLVTSKVSETQNLVDEWPPTGTGHALVNQSARRFVSFTDIRSSRTLMCGIQTLRYAWNRILTARARCNIRKAVGANRIGLALMPGGT